jgi:hypothetical protein
LHLIHPTLFGPAIGKSGWMVARYRDVTTTSIPGAASCRWWLAKSMSACDTAGMTALSRALARWDPIRVAAAALGLALLALVAAYGVSMGSSQVTLGAAVSAVALVGIACSGLLYAWRLGAGGIVD